MHHGPKLRAKLNQLFDWFDNTKEWDPVVAIAFFHYQFEILHPFTDGNGRLGRLVTILQLHQKELLDYPVLDISANALVGKMVEIGALFQLGDSVYERQFLNIPLLDYANNGF
jgi:Fic family protein